MKKIHKALVCSLLMVSTVGLFAKTHHVSKEKTEHSIVQPGQKVDLNKATLVQLESLKGIGAKKAQEIVSYRQAHGGFKSVDELTAIRGINQRLVDDLKQRVIV